MRYVYFCVTMKGVSCTEQPLGGRKVTRSGPDVKRAGPKSYPMADCHIGVLWYLLETRTVEPGGCFTNASRALQTNLATVDNARNHIYCANCKLKLCMPRASLLGTRTKFQLKILWKSTNISWRARETLVKQLYRAVYWLEMCTLTALFIITLGDRQHWISIMTCLLESVEYVQ